MWCGAALRCAGVGGGGGTHQRERLRSPTDGNTLNGYRNIGVCRHPDFILSRSSTRQHNFPSIGHNRRIHRPDRTYQSKIRLYKSTIGQVGSSLKSGRSRGRNLQAGTGFHSSITHVGNINVALMVVVKLHGGSTIHIGRESIGPRRHILISRIKISAGSGECFSLNHLSRIVPRQSEYRSGRKHTSVGCGKKSGIPSMTHSAIIGDIDGFDPLRKLVIKENVRLRERFSRRISNNHAVKLSISKFSTKGFRMFILG